MFDFTGKKPEDFHFTIAGENVRQHSGSIIIPVQVFETATGLMVFESQELLNIQFYSQLKTQDAWLSALQKIMATRIHQKILHKIAAIDLPIGDKIDLLNAAPTKLGEN